MNRDLSRIRFQMAGLEQEVTERWLHFILHEFSRELPALRGLEEIARFVSELGPYEPTCLVKQFGLAPALREINEFLHDAREGGEGSSADFSVDWRIAGEFPSAAHVLKVYPPRFTFTHTLIRQEAMIVSETSITLQPMKYGWTVELCLDPATHDLENFSREMRQAPGYRELAAA